MMAKQLLKDLILEAKQDGDKEIQDALQWTLEHYYLVEDGEYNLADQIYSAIKYKA